MAQLLTFSVYLAVLCLCAEAFLLWRMRRTQADEKRAELTMVPSVALCGSSFAMMLFSDPDILAAVASLVVLIVVGLVVVPSYRCIYARRVQAGLRPHDDLN